jgi:hypothetical protein
MYASSLPASESSYSATRLSLSPATTYGNIYSVIEEASLRETDLISPNSAEDGMPSPAYGDNLWRDLQQKKSPGR